MNAHTACVQVENPQPDSSICSVRLLVDCQQTRTRISPRPPIFCILLSDDDVQSTSSADDRPPMRLPSIGVLAASSASQSMTV